jgi:hypothetical protein
MKTGIFYNSSTSACSIFESGKMCYEALKGSSKYTNKPFIIYIN